MIWNIKEIKERVYLVEAKDQYNIASMFMRPQEYYESPYPSIRDNYFSVEQYMDRYAQETGSFTYFSDWDGFNIPSSHVINFFKRFKYDLTYKERILQDMILSQIGKFNYDDLFYLIGVVKGKKKVINHEIAHAYYYLNNEYSKKMDEMLDKIDISRYETAWYSLVDMGYDDIKVADEMQAYLSTSSRDEIIRIFGWDSELTVPSRFRTYFNKFNKSNK